MKNVLLFILLINMVVFSEVQSSFLKIFAWYSVTTEKDTTKHGCYGFAKINMEKQGKTTLWFNYSWWNVLFPFTYLQCKTNISDIVPDSTIILRKPDHFINTTWFNSFERLDTVNQEINFKFPILPQGTKYGRYDYFSSKVDSLMDLEFYGAGDSIMVGTFVAKAPDSRGAINILGRNAFILELTNNNPLRIRSVRCNAKYDTLLIKYLNYDLKKFTSKSADKNNIGWYGIDILESNFVDKIIIQGLKLINK